MQSYYRVSAYDEVIDVGGDWMSSTRAKGQGDRTGGTLLGRSIWTYIAGIETQSYLNAIFFKVRQAETRVEMPYRCDSRDLARLFRMVVRPDPVEYCGLHIQHSLIWQKPLPRAAQAKSPEDEDSQTADRCSVCCRFKLGEDWVDPLATPGVGFVVQNYRVCRACKTELMARLDHIQMPTSAFRGIA